MKETKQNIQQTKNFQKTIFKNKHIKHIATKQMKETQQNI